MAEPRGGRTAIVLLGLVGFVGVIQAATRPWAGVGPGTAVSVQSQSLAQNSTAVATLEAQTPVAATLLGLIGVLALAGVLLLRGALRRVATWVASTTAVATLIFVAVEFDRAPERVSTDVADLVEAFGASTAKEVSLTGWYWLAVVGAVLACAASIIAVRRVGTWPEFSSRYDAPATATAGSRDLDLADEHALWKALNEGEDPTA